MSSKPSRGFTICYSQSMENDPFTQEKEFPYELEIIYMETPNSIVFVTGILKIAVNLILHLNIKKINFSCESSVLLIVSLMIGKK